MSTPTPAAARWQALIDEYEASGLSARQFATERGVHPNTFAWWRSRIRNGVVSSEARQPARFVELSVVSDVQVAGGGFVVHLDRLSATLRIDAATDLRLVRALLEALC